LPFSDQPLRAVAWLRSFWNTLLFKVHYQVYC
jgi:hypothetical protein